MSIREKTVKGVIWNGIELFGGRFIQVGITIVLARILMPEDFGIIGLLIIFTEISKVVLDSGFSQALIRKQDVSQLDFSSVFYFNVIIGMVLYAILYIISPYISEFYNFEKLTPIARTVFLTVILNSFGIVPNAIIVHQVDFKKLANRTIIANLISGLVAIYLATIGYGVWALVIQMVLASFLRVGLLWISTKWSPLRVIDFGPVRSFFPFSRNLLLSGLFDVLATNIQTLLIGKFYTKPELGYYTQARLIAGIPSQTLTQIIRNVSYPTLSTLQNDMDRLKEAYRKVIQTVFFIVFPLMLGLMMAGDSLIPLVLGEKWIPAVPFFKVLCGVGAIYPLYSIGQNIFLVKGDGKLHLKVSFTKRVISLIMIVLTIKISVMALVIGHLVATIINTLITMYFSGKSIKYNFKEQIGDLYQIIILGLLCSLIIFLTGLMFISYERGVQIFAQIISGMISFVILTKFLCSPLLIEIKNMIFKKK